METIDHEISRNQLDSTLLWDGFVGDIQEHRLHKADLGLDSNSQHGMRAALTTVEKQTERSSQHEQPGKYGAQKVAAKRPESALYVAW